MAAWEVPQAASSSTASSGLTAWQLACDRRVGASQLAIGYQDTLLAKSVPDAAKDGPVSWQWAGSLATNETDMCSCCRARQCCTVCTQCGMRNCMRSRMQGQPGLPRLRCLLGQYFYPVSCKERPTRRRNGVHQKSSMLRCRVAAPGGMRCCSIHWSSCSASHRGDYSLWHQCCAVDWRGCFAFLQGVCS